MNIEMLKFILNEPEMQQLLIKQKLLELKHSQVIKNYVLDETPVCLEK